MIHSLRDALFGLLLLGTAALPDPRSADCILRHLTGKDSSSGAYCEARRCFRESGCFKTYLGELPLQAWSGDDPFPSRWRPTQRAWLDYSCWLYNVYDRLTDCWFLTNRDARWRMTQKVRRLIGERAYWTGTLPAVPAWKDWRETLPRAPKPEPGT